VRLKESHENGVVIFALSGAIDLHYAPTLRALFQSKLNKRCPALVVDLSAVDFIDSTGLAALIPLRMAGFLALLGSIRT